MKIFISILLSLILVLSFASCSSTPIVLHDLTVSELSGSVDSHSTNADNYQFKTKYYMNYMDKNSTKVFDVFGEKSSTTYLATVSKVGWDYSKTLYVSDDGSYSIAIHSQNKTITAIKSRQWLGEITHSSKELTIEEEFVSYARSLASKFINVDDFAFRLQYKEAPKPGHQTSYKGDEYIFIKQLAGYDTAERLIVSIYPNGGVGKIEYEAVDQFEDFKALDDDPDFKTVMEEALEKARIKTLLQGKGTYESEKIEYYLINDAGTLLLHYTQTGTYTPNVEEYQQAPYYDQPYTYQKSVIIPVAELS